MYCICRIPLICGLLAIGSAQATDVSGNRAYSVNPPTSADVFWKKVLRFLNQNGGYATREQFTQTFGIHFGYVDPEHTILTHQIAVISYRARSGIDWYFDALFQEFTAAWNMPGDPAISGAHIAWVISWSEDSFGDPKKGHALPLHRYSAISWQLAGLRRGHNGPYRGRQNLVFLDQRELSHF